MADVLKKIKDREDELGVRYTRMREDLGRYYLDSFVLKNKDGQAVKAARNTTLNDPRVFADRVIAVLSSAEPRIEVYGEKLPDDYESTVEDIWDHIVYDCNRRLLLKKLGELHSTLVTQAVLPGWVIVRGWVWKDGDQAKFDILPCDPLGVSFVVGADGLLWVANTQERSREDVEKEYGHVSARKNVLVRDYWGEEGNIVFVGNEKVKEEECGIIPFVIHPVGSRPPIGRDATEMVKYHGESVYSANRHMYDVRNEAVTIAKSLAYLTFRPPGGYASDTGTKLPEEYPYDPETMTAMGLTDKWIDLNLGNIKESLLFLWSVVDPASQRGSLVYSEYGELGFELSAIAIEKLEAHRDQVFVPRLKTLTAVYRDLAHLLFDQFVELGLPTELGDRGEKVSYKASDFKQEFSVKFGMSTVSNEKKIASYSIARAAEGLLSNDTKRRDILQVEKPEEEEAKMRDDEILLMVPEIRLSRHYDELGRRMEEAADADEKKSLEREQKIIELKLVQMGAVPGEASGRTGAPETEVKMPQLMTAQGQVEREGMRRKGFEREGV